MKFQLDGEKASEAAKIIFEKLSQYDNAITGKRTINKSERLKQVVPGIGITAFFAFCSFVFPFGITVEENASLVHIIMIPFIKIGMTWTLIIFLFLTLVCLLFTLSAYFGSASTETEYVKFE